MSILKTSSTLHCMVSLNFTPYLIFPSWFLTGMAWTNCFLSEKEALSSTLSPLESFSFCCSQKMRVVWKRGGILDFWNSISISESISFFLWKYCRVQRKNILLEKRVFVNFVQEKRESWVVKRFSRFVKVVAIVVCFHHLQQFLVIFLSQTKILDSSHHVLFWKSDSHIWQGHWRCPWRCLQWRFQKEILAKFQHWKSCNIDQHESCLQLTW